MTRTASIVAALLAASVSCAVAAGPPALGLWARGDGKAIVRIEKCGGALCAINTWIKPGTPDEKTGDKLVLKVAPLDGAKMSGEAFDPQRDLSYRIAIEAGAHSMTTQGCVLAGLLCKKMNWTREGTGQ